MNCCQCGKAGAKTREEVETIFYGNHQDKIPVKVPVRSCGDCGFEWTDEVSEDLRREAVIEYLQKRLHALEEENRQLKDKVAEFICHENGTEIP